MEFAEWQVTTLGEVIFFFFKKTPLSCACFVALGKRLSLLSAMVLALGKARPLPSASTLALGKASGISIFFVFCFIITAHIYAS
jgi:hypothetical protein